MQVPIEKSTDKCGYYLCPAQAESVPTRPHSYCSPIISLFPLSAFPAEHKLDYQSLATSTHTCMCGHLQCNPRKSLPDFQITPYCSRIATYHRSIVPSVSVSIRIEALAISTNTVHTVTDPLNFILRAVSTSADKYFTETNVLYCTGR
jgi:hypothetical protein